VSVTAHGSEAPDVGCCAGWLRDWGPTCIARVDPETGKRQVAGVHWDYDCYGAPGKIAQVRGP